MTLETVVIAGSIVAGVVSVLAAATSGRRVAPSGDRTITITIEDSAGDRTRTVAHSRRKLDELRRDIEGCLRGGPPDA